MMVGGVLTVELLSAPESSSCWRTFFASSTERYSVRMKRSLGFSTLRRRCARGDASTPARVGIEEFLPFVVVLYFEVENHRDHAAPLMSPWRKRA
jgi:hypothetical protein